MKTFNKVINNLLIKKFYFVLITSLVFCLSLTNCKSDVDLKNQSNNKAYGTIIFSVNEGSTNLNARLLDVSDISNAIVKIQSSDIANSLEQIVTVTSNEGVFTINNVPVGKNRIITVQAFKDNAKLDGIIIKHVADIVSGENYLGTINWETTKKASVYESLLKSNINIHLLTQSEMNQINEAIPLDVHSCLINSEQIALDFKNNSLKTKENYKLQSKTAFITVNKGLGYSIRIGDPLSTQKIEITQNPQTVTIDNVAPGTWNIYQEKDFIISVAGSITINESSNTATITVQEESNTQIQEFDGIKIKVAKSLGYNQIHYWACSDVANYPSTSWPGIALTEEEGNDYVFKFEGVNKVSVLITKGSSDKLCQNNIVLSEKGTYRITSSGATKETIPVAPIVTVAKTAKLGGKFAINVESNVPLTLSNITINGVQKILTVGRNIFNVDEFTTVPTTLSVLGSIKNAIGTTTINEVITISEVLPTSLTGNWNELRIYQVMVSSFQDGDPNVGYGTGYGPGPHNGDLQGVINALDYIKDLGMNAVWMTPIFTSDGNTQLDSTGYFCSDYFNVDPKFGGNDKFRELVEACHDKDMYVILDGVFGHHRSSGVSKASPNGKYPSGGSNPVKYPDSLDYYKEVAEYWIKEYQIDGWRLDQCYQVGLGDGGKNCNTGGHNYWYEIRKAVESAASSNGTKGQDWGTLGYMVGEHWNGDAAVIQAGSIAKGTAAGYGLKSCFDFPSRYRLVQMFATEESKKIGGTPLTNLDYVYSNYQTKGYTHDEGYWPNLFLTNHDLVRFGNLINYKYSENRSSPNYWKRHKVTLASIAAYSGPITLYYGDEYGMMTDGYSNGMNGWYDDNMSRDAGKISGFSTNEQDLHDYVAKLMQIRAENKVMWNGEHTTLKSDASYFVGKKTLDNTEVVFIINNGNSSVSWSCSGTDLVTGETVSGTAIVDGLSARFIKTK